VEGHLRVPDRSPASFYTPRRWRHAMFRWLARRLLNGLQDELIEITPDNKAVLTSYGQGFLNVLVPAFVAALPKVPQPRAPALSMGAPPWLSIVPKEYRGLAAMAAPLVEPMIARFLSSAASPPAGGAGSGRVEELKRLVHPAGR